MAVVARLMRFCLSLAAVVVRICGCEVFYTFSVEGKTTVESEHLSGMWNVRIV